MPFCSRGKVQKAPEEEFKALQRKSFWSRREFKGLQSNKNMLQRHNLRGSRERSSAPEEQLKDAPEEDFLLQKKSLRSSRAKKPAPREDLQGLHGRSLRASIRRTSRAPEKQICSRKNLRGSRRRISPPEEKSQMPQKNNFWSMRRT